MTHLESIRVASVNDISTLCDVNDIFQREHSIEYPYQNFSVQPHCTVVQETLASDRLVS